MEISQTNRLKGAEYSAILELSQEYEKKGFAVFRNHKIGDFCVDLYAEKNDVKYIFEFKSRPIVVSEQKYIEKLREYSKAHDILFRIVMVPVPRQKSINVESFEICIEDYFREDMPDALDQLSSDTGIIEIDELSINTIDIQSKDSIKISGEANAFVDLRYDDEDGHVTTESFPFMFTCICGFKSNGDLYIKEMTHLYIETTSFYGM